MTERTQVVVLGAGFGGLAMAYALAEVGIDDFVILERSDGVGGTWQANTYPGAACDVPSHLYSLSYAPNPDWSRTYASQPEILAYIEGCYERFDLAGKVRTNTTVVSARWLQADRCWRIGDDQGRVIEATVFVSAMGMFHTPAMPTIPGMDDFEHLDRMVTDPDLRARLRPDYPLGCKRTLVSSAFYPALQRDDVELVTDPIERISPHGIRTADGAEWPCDTIIWSTGFRATEYLNGITVTGRDGRDLHQQWNGVPRAWHGVAVPGFPNLFMLYGPNTNQGGNSIILMLEAQASFIADALAALATAGTAEVEVTETAMADYTAELLEGLAATVWTNGCDSYFRTPGGDVVTQIPHTAAWYRDRLERFDAGDFHLGSTVAP